MWSGRDEGEVLGDVGGAALSAAVHPVRYGVYT